MKDFAGLALGGLMALSSNLYAAVTVIDKEGSTPLFNFKI